jgi:D-alanyl-D-alanine carboxypeptidase/D-alanyl-D-alanine-endopeptidase (penicillin-binding protein 4)
VSHNGFAEALLKTVGRVASGAGSFAEGSRATRVVLAQTLGLDTTRLGVTDGSGLSRSNQVTAGATVQLLTAMARSHLAHVWEESLPVAARGAGSLRNRMGGTPAAGNLRAKTGTIRSVSSLSGYVRTADGERLAFSIVANDLPDETRAKRLEDQIGARLARFRR